MNYRVLVILASSIFLAGAAGAMCLQPAAQRCPLQTSDVAISQCFTQDKIDSRAAELSSQMKAESCMLSNKMNRREFLQAQCKTTTEFGAGGCGANVWRCLPNGNEGQVWSGDSNKIYQSLTDFQTLPPVPMEDTPSYVRICRSGTWVALPSGQ